MDLIGVTPIVPRQGETVVGENFYTAPGGKGANQAVAAARLGADVKLVGRVGKDSFGPSLLEGLRSNGVDVQAVAEDPDNPSGIAMILLDSARQNHIVAIYGANAACDEAQLEATYEALDGVDTLLLQLEMPSHLSLMAAKHAKSRNIRVIWDPAPALIMPSDALRGGRRFDPQPDRGHLTDRHQCHRCRFSGGRRTCTSGQRHSGSRCKTGGPGCLLRLR